MEGRPVLHPLRPIYPINRESCPKIIQSFSIGVLGVCVLTSSLYAGEEIICQSPDAKFALRCVFAEAQPYNGDSAIVEMLTHKTVLILDTRWTLGHVKLVWSPDSERVAYFSE